jgi:hypothetical protein
LVGTTRPSNPGWNLPGHQRAQIYFPAVRHKGAVTDRMERAALVAIEINPCMPNATPIVICFSDFSKFMIDPPSIGSVRNPCRRFGFIFKCGREWAAGHGASLVRAWRLFQHSLPGRRPHVQ